MGHVYMHQVITGHIKSIINEWVSDIDHMGHVHQVITGHIRSLINGYLTSRDHMGDHMHWVGSVMLPHIHDCVDNW